MAGRRSGCSSSARPGASLLRLDLDQAVCEDADRGCGHSGTDIEQGRCERQSADDRPLLRALALPWSTHPQHRDAWLP
ncbi:hypothetical protein GCM10025868_31660 [Angustibacter aerolatus]|uniref:Uncharacterized protein n=1 Tax=Angustibacter aerolatus TaxID=1162965 RepID=A0ABQ6JK21_9ACTN|nr:hypothetical protein GCM10025868_31660 [Angustibacter aerolatus]